MYDSMIDDDRCMIDVSDVCMIDDVWCQSMSDDDILDDVW